MPKTPRKKTSRPRSTESSAARKKTAVRKMPAKKAAARKTGSQPLVKPKPKAKRAARSVLQVVNAALDDLKAADVRLIDVRHLTTVTDTLAIASGRSDRHVRAIADSVVEHCEKSGLKVLGIEGEKAGEWVLVDLGDVVVHVMLPRVREFYNLEKLWDMTARDDAAEVGA